MSTRLNFREEKTVAAISKRLVSELRPLVAAQVKARNKVRDAHRAMVDRKVSHNVNNGSLTT